MVLGRKGGRKKKEKPVQRTGVRVPTELYKWADQFASEEGYSSATEVIAQALREKRERESAKRERKVMFDAWVQGGRKGPLPPGLTGTPDKA